MSNYMLETKESLWRRIGVNQEAGDSEQRSRTSSSSACSLPRKERPFRDRLDFDGTADREEANREDPYSKDEGFKRDITTPATVSILEQPPFAPPSMPLRRSEQWNEGKMMITQEESRLEVGNNREVSVRSGQSQLEDYNLQLSEMPESMTPLVYSKASRNDGVRFRKQTAKAILLKIRLAEAKDHLKRLKVEFLAFSGMMREEHEGLQRQVCGKYFQLQREQSVRVQESKFMHQQDCQQLKYELEMLRGKEDLLRYPVDSQLIPSHPQRHLHQENQELTIELANLQQKCALLEEENERISAEGVAFQRQMGEIEAKTMEVRQSNDKLYQYIFDLEQKVAYYQEEIPNISQRAQEHLQIQLNRELEQQAAAHYAQMSRCSQQIGLLQTEGTRLEQQVKKSNELIVQLQKDNAQLRVKLERIEEELKATRHKNQAKDKENFTLVNDNKKLRIEVQGLMKEREQMEQWKDDQRRESTSRLSRAFSTKQDKKLIEALEIEKIVLQKENIQLKATIEFQSKNQSYSLPYLPQKTYPLPYEAPSIHPLQHTEQKDMLDINERELISLQNYLEDEARRLQSKQRDIDSQYIKKTHQGRTREYAQPLPVRINTIDDYGMKKLPITHSKPIQQPRRNNFCSSETQAIIDKVKMRQRMKENGCACNDPRNCRCDVHSRGSRTSQDSNSRDYLRMQHHRPSDYSPGMQNYEYTKREDKSSKMKLIEDKVRRLKSELKSSFTTLNSS